jgi:DNA-binding response OmpR family regulator
MDEKGTILLVSKDHIFNDLIVQAVASEAYQVISCQEPERIGELVTPEVNLFIVDAAFPNGLELLEQIRSAFASTNIIALVDSDSAVESMRLQGIGIVDKRQSLEALLKAIRFTLRVAAWSRSNNDHVLVVDDDRLILHAVSDFLVSNGYTALTAQDRTEAIAAINLDPSLAVVLLAVMMPQVGGIETLTEIMKLKPHPAVIMMTAVKDQAVVNLAMKLGASDYLAKPVDFDALKASLSAAVNHFEYMKQSWWQRHS